MAQEGSFPSWLVALIGALPTAGILAWHRFWVERKDKRQEMTADLRDRARATMDAQSLAMYDRVELQNKGLVARLIEVDTDRNRGWDLARWWNSFAHQMKHKFSNTTQVANGRLERIGRIIEEIELEDDGVINPRQIADIKRLAKVVDIPAVRLPGLEDPIPRHSYPSSTTGVPQSPGNVE